MNNLAQNILDAVKTSFVESSFESAEELRPKLLFNDTKRGNTVLANIEKELNHCESFWFSVAFITKSGLVVLKETLKELEKKGIQGKILTTDYLAFNEPDALRELRNFKNLEIRVFTAERFHTKGYMFRDKEEHDKYTFIVGSSNLTQYALKANKEWNLKVISLEDGELIKETNKEFQFMWKTAEILTEEWISEYEKIYQENKKVRVNQKLARMKTYTFKLNKMQVEATRALEELRDQKEDKALIVSATGDRVIIVTGRRNTVNKRVSVA